MHVVKVKLGLIVVIAFTPCKRREKANKQASHSTVFNALLTFPSVLIMILLEYAWF